MRVFEDGSVVGSIGGGAFELKVIKDALHRILDGSPLLYEHHLLQEHEMCCGGTILVYIEPDELPCRLIVFGAGHVGQAVASLGAQAGFLVHVYDDRPDYLQRVNNDFVSVHCMNFTDAARDVVYGENTYIVILTYRHDIDRNLLRYCLAKPHAYLGMIGSKRKILVTKKMFLQEGVATEAELDAIDMPIGLAIGAETPFEIAVSIIAGLITIKNQHSAASSSIEMEIDVCTKQQH